MKTVLSAALIMSFMAAASAQVSTSARERLAAMRTQTPATFDVCHSLAVQRGYSVLDEDGDEHSAVMTIRGFLYKADHGSWKPGAMAENDLAVSVNYYKLEVDGEELIEMDDFDIKIGGESQYRGIRNALLL